MARTPCYDNSGLRKGTWTPEEDRKLLDYVTRYGCWNWHKLPKYAGLARCGKSCRLRWMNYLRPNIKRGNYSKEEEDTIIRLHESLGNRWSAIAAQLPGRTDNEIKNHWHTALKKRFKNIPQDQNKHKERGIETKPGNYIVDESIITPSFILESSLSSPQSTSSDQSSTITIDSNTDNNVSSDDNNGIFENLDLVNSGSFWTEPFFSDNFYEAQFGIVDGEIFSSFGFYDQLGNFNF